MSRNIVTARGKRKSKPAKSKLPPLLVEIQQPGQPLRISEQPDPRELFCAELGRQGAKWEITARPVYPPGLTPAADKFRVVLLDPTGQTPPEYVFESDEHERAARWVARWLPNHLGLIIAVIPPAGGAASHA
jgi:hypothetical protein